ncbi:MAG: diadenylate cyclase [Corallococcus sp.]|nr:diadenylate cyclase [Bacillota bacterium]MCM1534179.1 diadenylate cyclase [Corallococcus sp.]
MWEFIKNFFTTTDAVAIVGRIGLVIFISLVFYVLFYYSKKCNMQTLTILAVVTVLIVFALSFALPQKVAVIVALFATAIICATGLVLFSQDFHRDLFRMSLKRSFVENLDDDYGRDDLNRSVSEIVKACLRLSKTDTGALIIVANDLSDTILDSGTKVNAEISAELLETLFFPKTPLHDGAVVITDNKVVSAGCYLPLTQAHNLPREFGTRHRAAIGVSEAFPDLTAIVVSEETGIISAVRDGKVKRYLDADQLKAILEVAMNLSDRGAEVSIWGLTNDEEI